MPNFSATILLVGLIILLLIGIVLLLLLRLTSPTGELQERIHTYAWVPDEAPRRQAGPRPGRFYRMRRRLNVMLSALGSQEMNLQLMAANCRSLSRVHPDPPGFDDRRSGRGLADLRHAISGLALAILANLVPGILLRRAIHRRRMKFQAQLVDVLVLIQGAVRSGFSLLQAVEVVVRETESPAADEFGRVTREVSLGLTLTQALNNLKERMQNADLNLIVTAVNIHNQVGGNLTTMINAVTETVRERDHLFREARVITTQQRYTAYMLSLLPIALAGLIFMLSPEYITQFLRPGPYIFIPILAIVGIILGISCSSVLRRLKYDFKCAIYQGSFERIEMPSLTILIIGAGLAALGFFIFIVVLAVLPRDEVSRRLNEWVSEMAGPTLQSTQVDTVRRRELAGSFRTRVLQPWLKGIGAFFGASCLPGTSSRSITCWPSPVSPCGWERVSSTGCAWSSPCLAPGWLIWS